jgi:hypothetical protein
MAALVFNSSNNEDAQVLTSSKDLKKETLCR